MAFIIDKDIPASDLINTIKTVGGRLLTELDIFDVYTGDNVNIEEKSIAFSLTFSDETKTLTEEEVMVIFNNIINEVTKKHNASLRNK
jgi:phenylalanyl-tRNA synthetase beta chain